MTSKDGTTACMIVSALPLVKNDDENELLDRLSG